MDHDFIEQVVRHPPRSHPEIVLKDETTILAIDWREMEDAIVAQIAVRLGLPALVCKLVDAENESGYEAVVHYEGRKRRITLSEQRSSQGDTLRAVQTLLGDDYEIRYVGDTNGSDTAGVVVAPTEQWRLLYETHGKRLNEHFIPIAALPDIFAAPANELDAAMETYAEQAE